MLAVCVNKLSQNIYVCVCTESTGSMPTKIATEIVLLEKY